MHGATVIFLLLSCQHVGAGLLTSIEVKEEESVSVSEDNLQRRLKRRGEAVWKIRLGPALIEDLRWLNDDRIYVSLRLDSAKLENMDHFVVDAETGGTVWRKSRPKVNQRFSMLHADNETLLFAVDGKKGKRTVLALQANSGETAWTLTLKGPKKGTQVAPTIVSDAGLIIVVDSRKYIATAIRLVDGEHLWQRKIPKTESGLRALVTDGRRLWDPNGPLQAISLADGRSLWPVDSAIEISALVPPQIDNTQLIAIDTNRTIILMDAEFGVVEWRRTLPNTFEASNLFPLDDRLYVRGRLQKSGGKDVSTPYQLVAIDKTNGTHLWSHTTANPSLSNLIEINGFVYHASGDKIFKLDAQSGAEVFATLVTDTGRSFPVRLRDYTDHLVYIGELVVAGVDKESGVIKFKHGTTPISGNTSLNALDVSIPRLRKEMGVVQASGNGRSFSSGEAARYQNLSNSYHRQAQYYRSSAARSRSAGIRSNSASARSSARSNAEGDRIRADQAAAAGISASRQARTAAAIDMSISVINLSMALNDMWRLAGIKASVDRQILFRKSILTNYMASENIGYVYRPHSRYKSTEDDFVGVQVVNLETGRRKFNYLSPSYRSYGLWNLIDFERNRVIHHGIGLQSDDYRYSKSRKATMLSPKVKTIENFLIATPVRLPES